MATELLRIWLEGHVPGVPVRVVEGAERPSGAVCLALVDLGRADNHLRSRLPDPQEPPAHRLRLTYRVSAALDDPAEGHRALCAITFAALEEPILFTEDGTRLPLELLPLALARERFGPPEGAALFLELVIERARSGRLAPPVREPAVVNARPAPQGGRDQTDRMSRP